MTRIIVACNNVYYIYIYIYISVLSDGFFAQKDNCRLTRLLQSLHFNNNCNRRWRYRVSTNLTKIISERSFHSYVFLRVGLALLQQQALRTGVHIQIRFRRRSRHRCYAQGVLGARQQLLPQALQRKRKLHVVKTFQKRYHFWRDNILQTRMKVEFG